MSVVPTFGRVLAGIGGVTTDSVASFGRFFSFAGRTARLTATSLVSRRTWSLVLPQFLEVGNRTVPVMLVTGLFVGLVLAVQSFDQLKAAGFEQRMGILVNLTLVTELGPVLAGVMVAGRVGGALTAELGTMNVTEQLDALRVMGADPVRHLVVPRFLACTLLTPILTVYCDAIGALAGWFVAVVLKGVPSEPYWYYTADAVEKWDIMVGALKSFVFGGAIGLIACYKGFHCRQGAEGVGRACTESFVAIFITILASDFFIATFMQGIHKALYGLKRLI